MRIGDYGPNGRTTGAEIGVSRGSRADAASQAEPEQRTRIRSGAYSLSLSGRAAELARPAPVDPARIESLRDAFASPAWTIDAAQVAHRLMEEA